MFSQYFQMFQTIPWNHQKGFSQALNEPILKTLVGLMHSKYKIGHVKALCVQGLIIFKLKNKMQNMSMLIKSFFLQRNSIEAKIQLLLILTQQIIFISIINQADYAQIFPFLKDGSKLLLFLLLAIFLRYSLQIQLVELFGLVTIQSLSHYNNYLAVLTSLLLALLYISSTLSSISFDVSTPFLHSQSNNSNKIYIRAMTITSVIVLQILPNSPVFHIISCIAFVLLFLSKSRSLIKDQGYREVSLRFCLWAAFEHLKIFLSFFAATNTVFVAATFFTCSQLAFSIYNNKNRPSLNELQAKGDYLSLGFYILKNQSQQYFNEEIESFVKFFNQEEMQQHLRPICSVSELIFGKLSESNFLEGMMKTEIHIMNGHLLKATEMLARVSERVKWYGIIDQVIIYRMRKHIESRFTASQMVTIAYEEEYRAFLEFQQLLYKAALQNLRFNLYMNKTQIDSFSLKESCSKILKYEQKMQQTFEQIKNGFTQSTLLYVSYLLQVKNDSKLAADILTIQGLKSKVISDFNLDQKFYIKVKPEEDSLVIERVGYKVKQLLEYDRKDLEGQKVERLVPHFFRKHHAQLINAFIHKPIDKIHIFQKKTVVLNNKNTYSQCFLMLKLNYRIGEDFSYEGHFRIIPNNKHDLDSYLIVGAKGNIVECSRAVIDEELEGHPSIEKYFNQAKVGQPLVLAKFGGVETYEMLLEIKEVETPFYFYAKCHNSHAQAIHFIEQQVEEQTVETQEDPSLEQIDQVINNKETPILLALLLIMLCCLFVGEYLLLYSAKVKHNNQSFVVKNGISLMLYYKFTFRLGFAMTYLDLRDHFNYTNDAWCLGMDEDAINLHYQNEKLKPFNMGTYTIATSIPGMTVSHNNYKFVSIIYSEVLIYNKFKGDVMQQRVALSSVRDIVPGHYLRSLTDYRVALVNKGNQLVQVDIFYEYLSIIFTFSALIILFLFAFRLYWKQRIVEREVLSFRFANQLNKAKVDDIIGYLKTISLQTAPIDKITQQIHVYNTIVKTEAQNTLMRTEMSLVRENTGRKFMNETNPLEEANEKAPQTQENEKKMIQTSSYRRLLVVFLVLGGIIAGLEVGNLLNNSIAKNLDETASLSSIVTLYRASALYSRIFIYTINTMLIRQLRKVDNSRAYLQQFASFKTAMGLFTYPVFPETEFPQFSDFSFQLSQLTQIPVCQFMNCSSNANQINVNYLTLIKTMGNNLSQFVTNTTGMNNSALTTFISTRAHYLNLLYESQKLLRDYVVDLSIKYLDNYSDFADNLLNSKTVLIAGMMTMSALLVCYWAYVVVLLWREKRLMARIVRMYRVDQK